MKVLVTGGAGFIGSHLVEFHLQKGDSVWAVDNLTTGTRDNLAPFFKNPKLRFDKKDLLKWKDLKQAVLWADRIYHMAALVGWDHVLSHPKETLSCNIQGCEKILQAVSLGKKKQSLLIASSSSVYGMSENTLFKEDDLLHIPSGLFEQEVYALSKLVNEVMALSYSGRVNLNCCIARIFNAIGPRQTGRYGMVVPHFVSQAVKQEPLTVYGNGEQARSFCDVRDTIRAFDLLLKNPKNNGQIVNVGADREISIKELALLVKKLAKSSSKLKFIPYKQAYGMDFQETWNRKPSLAKLKRLTQFKHQYSLEETLNELIALKESELKR